MNYEGAAIAEYADRADGYAVRDELKWDQPSGTANTLKTLCSELRPRRVLELGVGTGRYFPYLNGEAYVGCDVCEAMLEHARRREGLLRVRGFNTVDLLSTEITQFLSGWSQPAKFDFVYSIGCVGYHVPVTPGLMSLIRRCMNAGGVCFLQTTQQSLQWRTRALLGHWKNRCVGKADNHQFFVATTERRLRNTARRAGLTTLWIREDSGRFFDRPMLLSAFRAVD